MAEHDPKDVENIVTLLRQTDGHRDYHEAAHDVLDHMQANGWKVTTREPTAVFNETWAAIHDAATLTPR